ncbi:hypothetical protein [Methanonatronarchaeum sp. AMET-Sl]|uniref:hypothetical protein n=1 Tax=Methanonatronarchaeum sp. AMET-Sl TaxID=3037654 RepID=UPI00244E0A73|nr:hypothetical protein [Methanonatronarchaeum sp. AMET-Sl]WGI17661.1 hypothetical protein QEN48_01235 [Methanonatronarchaeum sp. AMET-Sl]
MILDSRIFKYIEKVKSGKDYELWCTDVIKLMRKNNNAKGMWVKGTRFDIGTLQLFR